MSAPQGGVVFALGECDLGGPGGQTVYSNARKRARHTLKILKICVLYGSISVNFAVDDIVDEDRLAIAPAAVDGQGGRSHSRAVTRIAHIGRLKHCFIDGELHRNLLPLGCDLEGAFLMELCGVAAVPIVVLTARGRKTDINARATLKRCLNIHCDLKDASEVLVGKVRDGDTVEIPSCGGCREHAGERLCAAVCTRVNNLRCAARTVAHRTVVVAYRAILEIEGDGRERTACGGVFHNGNLVNVNVLIRAVLTVEGKRGRRHSCAIARSGRIGGFYHRRIDGEGVGEFLPLCGGCNLAVLVKLRAVTAIVIVVRATVGCQTEENAAVHIRLDIEGNGEGATDIRRGEILGGEGFREEYSRVGFVDKEGEGFLAKVCLVLGNRRGAVLARLSVSCCAERVCARLVALKAIYGSCRARGLRNGNFKAFGLAALIEHNNYRRIHCAACQHIMHIRCDIGEILTCTADGYAREGSAAKDGIGEHATTEAVKRGGVEIARVFLIEALRQKNVRDTVDIELCAFILCNRNLNEYIFLADIVLKREGDIYLTHLADGMVAVISADLKLCARDHIVKTALHGKRRVGGIRLAVGVMEHEVCARERHTRNTLADNDVIDIYRAVAELVEVVAVLIVRDVRLGDGVGEGEGVPLLYDIATFVLFKLKVMRAVIHRCRYRAHSRHRHQDNVALSLGICAEGDGNLATEVRRRIGSGLHKAVKVRGGGGDLYRLVVILNPIAYLVATEVAILVCIIFLQGKYACLFFKFKIEYGAALAEGIGIRGNVGIVCALARNIQRGEKLTEHGTLGARFVVLHNGIYLDTVDGVIVNKQTERRCGREGKIGVFEEKERTRVGVFGLFYGSAAKSSTDGALIGGTEGNGEVARELLAVFRLNALRYIDTVECAAVERIGCENPGGVAEGALPATARRLAVIEVYHLHLFDLLGGDRTCEFDRDRCGCADARRALDGGNVGDIGICILEPVVCEFHEGVIHIRIVFLAVSVNDGVSDAGHREVHRGNVILIGNRAVIVICGVRAERTIVHALRDKHRGVVLCTPEVTRARRAVNHLYRRGDRRAVGIGHPGLLAVGLARGVSGEDILLFKGERIGVSEHIDIRALGVSVNAEAVDIEVILVALDIGEVTQTAYRRSLRLDARPAHQGEGVSLCARGLKIAVMVVTRHRCVGVVPHCARIACEEEGGHMGTNLVEPVARAGFVRGRKSHHGNILLGIGRVDDIHRESNLNGRAVLLHAVPPVLRPGIDDFRSSRLGIGVARAVLELFVFGNNARALGDRIACLYARAVLNIDIAACRRNTAHAVFIVVNKLAVLGGFLSPGNDTVAVVGEEVLTGVVAVITVPDIDNVLKRADNSAVREIEVFDLALDVIAGRKRIGFFFMKGKGALCEIARHCRGLQQGLTQGLQGPVEIGRYRSFVVLIVYDSDHIAALQKGLDDFNIRIRTDALGVRVDYIGDQNTVCRHGVKIFVLDIGRDLNLKATVPVSRFAVFVDRIDIDGLENLMVFVKCFLDGYRSILTRCDSAVTDTVRDSKHRRRNEGKKHGKCKKHRHNFHKIKPSHRKNTPFMSDFILSQQICLFYNKSKERM